MTEASPPPSEKGTMGGILHLRGDRPGGQAQLLPQLHGSCSRPQLNIGVEGNRQVGTT
jgi:hypothetical protein